MNIGTRTSIGTRTNRSTLTRDDNRQEERPRTSWDEDKDEYCDEDKDEY